MATLTATGNFPSDLIWSLQELSNQTKVPEIYDFAYGEYRSFSTYVDQMSAIQNQITTTGKVRLNDGLQADINNLGGMYAIQLYIESLTMNKDTMSGLSKLGLANEKRLWQLQ